MKSTTSTATESIQWRKGIPLDALSQKLNRQGSQRPPAFLLPPAVQRDDRLEQCLEVALAEAL